MARYIDIDKVKPDCISTKGGVAVSQSQLANQPTADVVERSKIDKAIEEIETYLLEDSCGGEHEKGVQFALEILKRNIGEYDYE